MAYKNKKSIFSIAVSPECEEKLMEMVNMLQKRSKVSLASEIVEQVVDGCYEQLKDGEEGAKFTVNLQKGKSTGERLLWRDPAKQNKV